MKWWSRMKWWKKILFVVIAVIILVFLFLPLGPLGIWFSFRGHLAQLRINPWLATLVSLGFFSLGTLALKWSFAPFAWGKHRWKHRWGRILSGVWLVVWCLANAYMVSRVNFSPETGEPEKWYCYIPDIGFRVFDEEGYDPVYSVRLKPLTADIALEMEREQVLFTQVDPRSSRDFFDRHTGEALVFYVRYPNGCYILYNKRGFDPTIGVPLQPTTPQLVPEILAQAEQPECVALRDKIPGAIHSNEFPALRRTLAEYAKFQ